MGLPTLVQPRLSDARGPAPIGRPVARCNKPLVLPSSEHEHICELLQGIFQFSQAAGPRPAIRLACGSTPRYLLKQS
jgi:hypothetical protein